MTYYKSILLAGANGLTFEDQLLVIADNTAEVSVEEKVRKVVNLAISATCRALLNENDKLIDLEPGSSDEKRAELVDTLASALGQRPLMQVLKGLNGHNANFFLKLFD